MKGLIVHRLCTLCTHHHSGKNPLLPMQLRFCKPLINIYFKTLPLHRLTVSLMWLFSNKQQSLLTCNASMPLRYTVVPGCSYVSKKKSIKHLCAFCCGDAVQMTYGCCIPMMIQQDSAGRKHSQSALILKGQLCSKLMLSSTQSLQKAVPSVNLLSPFRCSSLLAYMNW